ncbi:polymerase delta 4 [Hibiscus trionum]|uniref:Polymerase delta 4 n=1 Tax=Hibiscus trionum TaxID=183268 RepID=A0A9W7GSW1_HIBTR|nr:polymerase delta 4 [Hibiscus trionum]
MKGFYRQKKKQARGTRAKSKSSKPTKSLDMKDGFCDEEQALRQFDMNMAYGPCLGITRVARLERAQRLGLEPPKQIQHLLKGENVKVECLLDGRV